MHRLRVRIRERSSRKNVSPGRVWTIWIMFQLGLLPGNGRGAGYLDLKIFKSERHVQIVTKPRANWRPNPRKARHGEKAKMSPRWNILRGRCTFSAVRIQGSSLCGMANNCCVTSAVHTNKCIEYQWKEYHWISHVMFPSACTIITYYIRVRC